MNTGLLRALFLLLGLALLSTARAVPLYSGLVVLGDSLSDQGNTAVITGGLVPPPEYFNGRFSNGPVYIDQLASDLGQPLLPSLYGGSNYAAGGARTDSASVGGIPIGPFSLLDQRDAYLAGSGGVVDGNALHVVWGGANDLADIVDAVQLNPGYDAASRLQTVVGNIASVITSLALAGAGDILVPNAPNLGLVPLITATNGGLPVPEATALSLAFNAGLDAALDQIAALFPATGLIRFDTFGLLSAAYADPAGFGLTNVTDACYSLFGLPGGTTCATPEGYLSWDGYHPTAAGHALLAGAMLAALPETAAMPAPASLALIGMALLGAGVARRRPRT